MFFGFSSNNIRYVDMIGNTITIKLIEPEFDIHIVSYTFDSRGNAYMNLQILIDKYNLIPTERINVYTSKN